eukprot:5468025-Pyramimonas_sp.AAC.1
MQGSFVEQGESLVVRESRSGAVLRQASLDASYSPEHSVELASQVLDEVEPDMEFENYNDREADREACRDQREKAIPVPRPPDLPPAVKKQVPRA